MNTDIQISKIQAELDKKGIFTNIHTVNSKKHDLIINFEVKATSSNKEDLAILLIKLLKCNNDKKLQKST